MMVDWVYNTKLLTYTNIPPSLVDTSPSDCIVLYVFALYSLLHQFADPCPVRSVILNKKIFYYTFCNVFFGS